MSPTQRELVSNKSLQGTELAQIILSDVSRMLSENGLLCGQMAYPRVSYELRLTLHLGLPSMPSSIDTALSRPQATDRIAANPSLAAIEAAPPLAPRAEDDGGTILDAHALSRDIDSPNAARVLHQLPVEVSIVGQDGHQTERLVEGYTPESVGMTEEQRAEPDLSDVSDEVRKELGL